MEQCQTRQGLVLNFTPKIIV